MVLFFKQFTGETLEKKGKDNGGPAKEPQDNAAMGSSPSASKIFKPQGIQQKRDLYSDLQKIEERGKRKKGFSFFSRK